MKVLLINLIILFSLVGEHNSLFTSHFIDLPKGEVKQLISNKHYKFKLNTTTINNAYNYLKYEDSIREITVLFFLTADNKCKAVRLMSDYSNINDIITVLNEKYTKVDKSNWTYSVGRKSYSVILEEGDWFFTISIKEKED